MSDYQAKTTATKIRRFSEMQTFLNSPFQIGHLSFPHRLIQGPLAGYSCAPFRTLFYPFQPPAYGVSEMISAQDALSKQALESRYLMRSPEEKYLAYQIAGCDAKVLGNAAKKLATLGADMIDINCGCPKAKIRKKGAGSALLAKPDQLVKIIKRIRASISVPLTLKIRIQGNEQDIYLAEQIEQAGADALIVHGRRWQDDYDIACDFQQISLIKQAIDIPVIANGDIANRESLYKAWSESGCDAFMISRAACGRPWLFAELLSGQEPKVSPEIRKNLFMQHLQGLAALESPYKAVLQSKSLVRYYFRQWMTKEQLSMFYRLTNLSDIEDFLHTESKAQNQSADISI
ncbi:nitrogen regulation protein [Legionella israelensis]|uniref:tRNA-dihydrouridine synthase n=2 Tax=Legionella israelensis TaxID=454 RepID=A0A0W0WQJ7_9GAMM|nr:nitrogen regulation protein [Legionella israelensis]SCX99720.1 putative TIM-barrel protein, nifR3 family [Legionella israelensis DSM 19235]STX60406.1 nitrogen regulation protein [Legionella israelensis]